MNRNAIFTGVAAGLAGGFWMLYSALNFEEGSKVQLMSGPVLIVILLISIFALQLFSRFDANNRTAFKQSFKTGLLAGTCYSVLLGLATYIYCTQINPGFAETMINNAEKYFLSEGKTMEEVEENSRKLREVFTVRAEVSKTLFMFMFSSLIFSLAGGLLSAFRPGRKTK
jgi:hypothetical protein